MVRAIVLPYGCHIQIVVRIAQLRDAADHLLWLALDHSVEVRPEFLGQAGQEVVFSQVALRLIGNDTAEFIDPQSRYDGCEVGDELVESCRLRGGEQVVAGTDAIEDRMPGFVRDDIVGQAGVPGRAGVAVVVALDGLAAPVVEGVLSEAGVGYQDQTVSIGSPGYRPPESQGAFKEIQDALGDGPDVHLMKLVQAAPLGIEDFSFWPDEMAQFLIPLRRRNQYTGVGVEIHDREARTGRAIPQAGFPFDPEWPDTRRC